ncbi:MAG: type II toxin-antitoxin system PemK/MazF family toxin [Planctomycetes bacterium]|nr:type II toxin-antitoxin system PemK/MazF family toxin [Planctomycetota bacterium]
MEKLVKGDVVVVPFPFSDLTGSKRRPALVIAELEGDDIILCQITSQTVRDKYALAIKNDSFISGTLNQDSNVRPNRIFTADSRIIIRRVGQLEHSKIMAVVDKIVEILRQ